ncbi:Pcc1 domain-containing protein [Rhizoctonia solani AG-1 IA]|uniref:Pcc1 domain-containing protein n=1 Tax=Thanatephorus cucumeris (strain AG1-IA) TaxID=983506 RepID=L8WQ86_THACA|nr:Pcc1 domain-containing protein [Rhizoctonia solani AG-1 IA]
MATNANEWHTITVRVPFLSPAHASIAQKTIQVDKELQPHAVKRTLTVEGNDLVASCVYGVPHIRTFSTLTLRLARLTLNGFLENVDLVSRTMMEFGDHATNVNL